MSDRKNSRLILPGLIAVTLMAASAVYFFMGKVHRTSKEDIIFKHIDFLSV